MGGTLHRSKCSDYAQENPSAERASKSPEQLKGQNFLHLRDTALNKPVKHGLDLLNMKTTGLKYNLAGRKGNVPRKLSNGEASAGLCQAGMAIPV